jgi:hypothetical protein
MRQMQRLRWLAGAAIVVLTACGTPQADGDAASVAQFSAPVEQAPLDPTPSPLAVPSLAPVTRNEEQREAMDDPRQTVQLWLDLLVEARYDEIEPLLEESLRQSFAARDGSAEQFYQNQALQYGALRDGAIVGQRTPYDSDRLVAIDVDLRHERQTLKQEIDVLQTDAGWQIVNFGPRRDGALADIKLDQELRQTLSDPENAIRHYYDLVQAERFGQLEPIFTFYARSTGNIEQQHREEAREFGKLQSYRIVGSRTSEQNGEQFWEADVDLVYERQTLEVKTVAANTPQGWKINHIVPRR